jgi:hypothetical protein
MVGIFNKITEELNHFLTLHLNPNADEFINMLYTHYSYFDDFIILDRNENVSTIKKEKNRLARFCITLNKTIGYLSIIDSLADPAYVNNIDTVTEKNDFILTKLNKLFGDESYLISLILEYNCIKFRKDEPEELAYNLEKRGYLVRTDTLKHPDKAKISVKGASYIERKHKRAPEKDTRLNLKIDEIIDHLVKLGYGQEIIFNEIEELRTLQNKLSKKSWKQLLKGKLLDLAIDNIISKDTAVSVYEYLTDNSFRLLK